MPVESPFAAREGFSRPADAAPKRRMNPEREGAEHGHSVAKPQRSASPPTPDPADFTPWRVAPPAGSPSEVLTDVQRRRFVVQDFRPMEASLEWELGRLFYEDRGSLAFRTSHDHVPFEVNNDGTLSARAADLFFTSLLVAEAAGTLEERVYALEIGPGPGLFARGFLDAFRELCASSGKDFYDQLEMVIADQSQRMLIDIGEREVLGDHAARCRPVRLDAVDVEAGLRDVLARIRPTAQGATVKGDSPRPTFGRCPAARKSGQSPCAPELGQSPGEGPFRAIFLNYLLDSLPASVVQAEGDLLSRLCVRTCLARNVDLAEYTTLTREEIAQKAASGDPREKRDLVDLYPLFGLEYAYRPVEPGQIPYSDFAAQYCRTNGPRVVHNYGALQCLEGCLKVLHRSGFILINDYGQTIPEKIEEGCVHQKFAGSTAIGLNFPLVRGHFEGLGGCCWVEPEEESPSVHARLLGREPAAQTVERFREKFGKAALAWVQEPAEQARAHWSEGRCEAALAAFLEALRRQPRNWSLMGQLASFLAFSLQDHAAALKMVQAALALNPSCSCDLWNTLGEVLLSLRNVEGASEAFQRALEVDGGSVRARVGLTNVHLQRRNYGGALRTIAEGLTLDRAGEHREHFLATQADILRRMEYAHRRKLQLLSDRVSRKE